MSAIQWATIKTALHTWFTSSTGLAAERVLYRGQNIARPPGTGAWISLRFMSVRTEGRPSITRKENPSPSPGAEMLRITHALSRVTYQATCFPPTPPDDGAAVPDASEAHALLHEAVMNLDTMTRRALLNIAGIGLLKCEPILPLDGVVNSVRFEPRAVLSFNFLVPSQIVETITNIETVNLSVETTGTPNIVRNFALDLDP